MTPFSFVLILTQVEDRNVVCKMIVTVAVHRRDGGALLAPESLSVSQHISSFKLLLCFTPRFDVGILPQHFQIDHIFPLLSIDKICVTKYAGCTN